MENSALHSWLLSDAINIAQEVSYDIGFVGGEAGFSCTHGWGESRGKTETITIGEKDGLSLDSEPGQEVKTQLRVNKAVMKFLINYKYFLTGDILVFYKEIAGYYENYPIEQVIYEAVLESEIICTEEIDINY